LVRLRHCGNVGRAEEGGGEGEKKLFNIPWEKRAVEGARRAKGKFKVIRIRQGRATAPWGNPFNMQVQLTGCGSGDIEPVEKKGGRTRGIWNPGASTKTV